MTTQLMNVFATVAALIVGAIIGAGFGMIQDAARHRNEKRQAGGKLDNGWAVMPGSGARIMVLVLVLVMIQVVCPLLFKEGAQWWVAGGVAGGYGFVLFQELRQRLSRSR